VPQLTRYWPCSPRIKLLVSLRCRPSIPGGCSLGLYFRRDLKEEGGLAEPGVGGWCLLGLAVGRDGWRSLPLPWRRVCDGVGRGWLELFPVVIPVVIPVEVELYQFAIGRFAAAADLGLFLPGAHI